jgi:excisionase family DNA binding protein
MPNNEHKPKPELSDRRASLGQAPIRNSIALSPSEAAKALGVGRTFLYSVIRNGSLKTSKIGTRKRL